MRSSDIASTQRRSGKEISRSTTLGEFISISNKHTDIDYVFEQGWERGYTRGKVRGQNRTDRTLKIHGTDSKRFTNVTPITNLKAHPPLGYAVVLKALLQCRAQ